MECLEILIPHHHGGPGWDLSDSSICSGCAIPRRPRLQRPFYSRIHKWGFPRHMASCITTKCVQSPRNASKPSSATAMEVLDGIYLTLPSVLGALLLGDPVSNSHFIAEFTKGGFQGTWRDAFNTAKCVQSRWNASKSSSSTAMEVLDGIYLTLPSVLGALLPRDPVAWYAILSAKGGFQDTWRAATRLNAFIADGMPRNPHPRPPLRAWMGFI